jgi:PAS domain S-box-containing protein
MAEKVLAREFELVESEEKFRTLLRSVPEPLALALWDEAIILEANEAYCGLLGFSQDEVTGRTFLDLCIWADLIERTQILNILSSESGVASFDCRLRAKSGEIKTVLLSVKKVDMQRRQGMLVIMRDISERKRAEAERMKLERQIRHARKAESLAQMAGAIAHHFNNKLMAVSGNLELALKYAGPDKRLLARLGEAQRATAQAAEVSNLMLAYLGSVFRVFWPVVEQRPEPLQQIQTEVFGPIAGSGLVLFVDDEAQLRHMAQEMLGHSGFRVITASHGLEALEVFSERQDEISLVILDLTMPGMNGWETMEALRALRPDIPVILSSGYDEAKVMEGEHAEIPQAFLHKPYLMTELKTALCAAMEHRVEKA